jgi:hypothetical protein
MDEKPDRAGVAAPPPLLMIRCIAAGDAACNDVHLFLVESNPQSRLEWISALDTIESLNPRAVIAGHKKPENDDSPESSKRLGSTFTISTA